jgi:hypothetical protein
MNSPTLTINKAIIEVTETTTQINAIINGKYCAGWCLFAGTTNAHVDAAFDYLIDTVGLSCSDITFIDSFTDDEAWESIHESRACGNYI